MEEDGGVSVKVTRLRRRLSIEQQSEDVSSPSTPNKKGGRLAAKPQLEHIIENAQVNSPRKTRKSIAKDVADEDKPVTPSRRSTRIKSNTSILSETLSNQVADTPRAKRAIRRNSAAGSDNEGPATPARQTRRTRKESASSVENQESSALNRPKVVEMVIAEEPETEVYKTDIETVVKKSKSPSSHAVEELSPNSARKSKRLLEKRNRRSGSNISDHDSSVTKIEVPKTKAEKKLHNELNKSAEVSEVSEKLSNSNLSLLKKVNTESKVKKLKLNKSVSDLDSELNEKKRRKRTESWPVLLAVSSGKDNLVLFSDNEQGKEKKRKSANSQSFFYKSRSALNRSDIKDTDTATNERDTSQMFLDSPSKRKKRQSETSFTIDVNQPSENVELTEKLTPSKNSSRKNENTVKKLENNDIANDMEMLFQDPPGNVQAIVYFEDSDSSIVNAETSKNIQQLDSEDQCVPVIKHDVEYQDKMSPKLSKPVSNSQEKVFSSQSNPNKEPGHDVNNSNKVNEDVNNSCEPMDIDETIHEQILQKSPNALQESITERKSLTSPQVSSIMEETNKSKRKSSISARNTPDRSRNENKTTLILSQIKDVSATSENTQSPKPEAIESSNSNTIIGNDNKVSKTNLSSNDLKETPLRPKNVTNLTMQTSTPITTPKIENKTMVEQKNPSSKNICSNLSKSIDEVQSSDEDSNEPSQNKSKLLDDEAEEASDDYESGDSRDEEEKLYEDEHEIIVRGEALSSDDDDVSNDSDYEKDSFVVSSDAEDYDLLSGSGDDLLNSDNELSMSKKSKKKYNERKLKEQKVASREMFESRHKLNTSEQKSPAPKAKNNRMRIDSSLLESDEEVVVKPKKNTRLRLDSTLDTSAKQEDTNEPLNKSKGKSDKSLQRSICNLSANNEKEITVCDESISNSDPLQVNFKQEPRTPQKDLNISVVQFTDRLDIENVEVVGSDSILNQTETDPLQATMVCGDTSDSSESEEIMQNYDSVLNELNKNKSARLSNNNVSLNMDKKVKNRNVIIIDQHNSTKTRSPNKKAQSISVVDCKTTESSKKAQDSDIESSNSIDLQLLFSEDNCGSEVENTTIKHEQQNNKNEEEIFVPLRKSISKTNICESKDMNVSQQNLSLAEKSNKKKKRKTYVATNESLAELEDPNQSEQSENALSTSLKKKNRKSSLVPSKSVEEPLDPNQSELGEKALSASLKKKNRKSSLVPSESVDEPLDPNQFERGEKALSASLKKKNRKSSLVPSESVEEPLDTIKSQNETSLNESSKKAKKRKFSITTTDSVEEAHDPNQAIDDVTALNKSGSKKKKQRTSLSATELEEKSRDVNEYIDAFLDESSSKKKNNTNTLVEEPQDVPDAKFVTNESMKKKKKLKSSSDTVKPAHLEGDLFFIDTTGARVSETDDVVLDKTPVEVLYVNKKKKNKKLDGSQNVIETNVEYATISEDNSVQNCKKRKRKCSNSGVEYTISEDSSSQNCKKQKRKCSNSGDIIQVQVNKNKKRKERDEDNDSKKTKVSKERSFQELHEIPLLPADIISQLEDKPRKVSEKPKVISTSKFTVETARQKRPKPSNYLEESIYLNADSPLVKQQKSRITKPKVLPFIPTASISGSGYTTNFKINKVYQNVQFVAEPTGITFSKEKYLQKKEIKRLGTYSLYKRQINKKLSKF